MAHPASPQARHGQALRLHLPVEDLPREGQGQGEDVEPPRAKRTVCELLRRINPVLRGWTNYFRHGVSKATFGYLRAYVWARVVNWLRHKHPRANWKWLRRRYLPGWWPTENDVSLFDPGAVAITYYRYRGHNIDTPWKPPALA